MSFEDRCVLRSRSFLGSFLRDKKLQHAKTVLVDIEPLNLFCVIFVVIKALSESLTIDFQAFYCMVGIWNAVFLFLYAVGNASKLMRWSTRSCEETFGTFVALAFSADAITHIQKAFKKYYDPYGVAHASRETINSSTYILVESQYMTEFNDSTYLNYYYNSRDIPLLWLILTLGTVLLGLWLYKFRTSPYFSFTLREVFSDYALAIAVIIMSVIGSVAFKAVQFESFATTKGGEKLNLINLASLSVRDVFVSMALGFCLSLLFLMDQGFGVALTDTPQHQLKKPSGYHYDLLIVSVINIVLSLYGLPWVHAALPHCPLHVKALADTEERVDDGYVVQKITKVREQRVSALAAHVLIGLSILVIPSVLIHIPRPVLDGLFLFVAITSLYGNQFFERLMLFITDLNAYPPNHYLRRVPKKVVHMFTLCQAAQLILLAIVGFQKWTPYLKMGFPILIAVLLPVRHLIIPRWFDKTALDAIDNAH